MKGETWDDVDGLYFVLIFLLGLTLLIVLVFVYIPYSIEKRYENTLYATQDPAGRLRDRSTTPAFSPPSEISYESAINRNPDAYTLYCLSGLSAA
jgi:hypothetical protein